jgi:hypothetical protein
MPKGTENTFMISSHIIVVRKYARLPSILPVRNFFIKQPNNVILTYKLLNDLVYRDNNIHVLC